MFTGIIEELGEIEDITVFETGIQLKINGGKISKDLTVKSSISVNGCCLTCTGLEGDFFIVDIVEETLRKSCLGDLKCGDAVNLELPLKLNARLDGHLVQGHVDYTGTILSISDCPCEMTFQAPSEMMRYVIEKGSITIDGVSLTAWNVANSSFSVALIPYTLKHTALGKKPPGSRVNFETDLIAKYVEKLRTF